MKQGTGFWLLMMLEFDEMQKASHFDLRSFLTVLPATTAELYFDAVLSSKD